MLLKYAELFRDVAGFRSFSRAAEARGVSQPAVSQAIQQLEDHFGVKLLDRSTRPLTLTHAGQIYLDGCGPLLERFQAVEDAVRASGDCVAGEVRVAAIYSLTRLRIGAIVDAFEADHPQARVVIEYCHPDEVAARVIDGRADVGVTSYPRLARSLCPIDWQTQKMTIVVPPGHPLAGRRSASLSELDGETMVALTPELATRRQTDAALRAAGARVRVVGQFDNIDTVRRSVEEGAGVAILPRATVLRDVQAGALFEVSIEGEPLTRPLGLVRRKRGRLPAAAAAFVDAVLASGGEDAASPGDDFDWHRR